MPLQKGHLPQTISKMPLDEDDLQRGIVNFAWGIVNVRWATHNFGKAGDNLHRHTNNFGKGIDNLDQGTKNSGEGSPEIEGAGLDVHSGGRLGLGSARRAEEARNCPG